MRPTFAAVAALAIVCACGAYTGGPTSPGGGLPIGGGTTDAGGAGSSDGGDGGIADAGDGGCTALTLSPGNAGILDGCISSLPTTGVGSVSVNTASCTVIINMTTGTGGCTGSVRGSLDAFDGGCGGNNQCYSTSLPGNIICITGPSSSCQILICDGGC
jgi:hypothetical protein